MRTFDGGVSLEEFGSAEAVASRAAEIFAESAAEAMVARGRFRVALAGGTTSRRLHEILGEPSRAALVAWQHVHVFFGDERCVPEGSPERNDRAAGEALLSRVPIPPGNVHRVEAERPDADIRYERDLSRHFRLRPGAVPRLDLVLLGVGEDGHTASLFPGRPEVEVTDRLVVRVVGAPKPPPDRVTLTLPVLRAARLALFLVVGAAKAAVARRALAGDPSLPASRVRPALWLGSGL